MIAWTEGRFIDPHSPLVGASDPGLMTGQGMFDTIAAYHGRLWALEAHLSRLSASLTAAHIPQPQVDLDEGARLVAAHLRNVPVARIRITVLNTHEGSRTVITATPEPHAPALGAPHPTDARVAITPWARSPLMPFAGHKSTSYAHNIQALHWAYAQGADEGLWHGPNGGLCEGSVSNLLTVVDDQLATASAQCGVLPGVTLAVVREVCHELGGVRELSAVEVGEVVGVGQGGALVGTLRMIQPIGVVDGVPGEVPGVIRRAQELVAAAMPDFLADA